MSNFVDVENPRFLSEQIITYMGNKRKLLDFIEVPVNIIKKKLGKSKLNILDGFSGSGVVSRYFKQHSNIIHTNDMEKYVEIINKCYLSNKSEFDENIIKDNIDYLNNISTKIKINGIIRKNYSPVDDDDIKKDDRCFYTNENANIIDTIRNEIDNLDDQHFYLAPLLYKSSINCNTSGVFKGFYKDKNTKIGKFGGTNSDALSRITDGISLPYPIFSNYESEYHIHRGDTNQIVKQINTELDLAYFDPPYNQHPYGSNYFMLNVILENKVNEKLLSKISGIPNNWNKSEWNRKTTIKNTFEELIQNTNSKYILISYNNEGFLSYYDFFSILEKYGKVEYFEKDYTVFRGGNIKSNNRSSKVKELLFLLEK
jgi:adenine-specific DNA-methyltransferase